MAQQASHSGPTSYAQAAIPVSSDGIRSDDKRSGIEDDKREAGKKGDEMKTLSEILRVALLVAVVILAVRVNDLTKQNEALKVEAADAEAMEVSVYHDWQACTLDNDRLAGKAAARP